MVTVRRLNTDELLDMLWEELPEMAERQPAKAASPFEIAQEGASGPALPEPFSRPRRRP